MIPFAIAGSTRGILTTAPDTVSPSVGAAGARFSFTLRGFKGDFDDGENDQSNNAEKVAFWINIPDGQAIRAVRPGLKNSEKDEEKATVARASRAGTVAWTWQAPADAPRGIYTLVAHGLESEQEQVVAFEIR